MFSLKEAFNINSITQSIVAGVIIIIGGVILAVPYNYIKHLKRSSLQKEYAQYLYFRQNPSDLTNMFLDKIARSLGLAALWIFAMFLYLSPVWQVSNGMKFAYMSLLTTVFSCLTIFALSKPVNLYHAIRYPEKYERLVRKRLGELPENIVPKA